MIRLYIVSFLLVSFKSSRYVACFSSFFRISHLQYFRSRRSESTCGRIFVQRLGETGDPSCTFREAIVIRDQESLLATAFAALDEKDKYDTVLTGLCMKILDGKTALKSPSSNEVSVQIAEDATLTRSEKVYKILSDPILLIKEMNRKKVKATSRSLVAIVDSFSSMQDVRAMATAMSLIIKNGSSSFYGSQQKLVTPFPTSTEAVLNPEKGKIKMSQTRTERLAELPDIPTDDRVIEVVTALSSMGIVGFSLIAQGIGNALGMEDISAYTNLLVGAFLTVVVFDNFYDAFRFLGNTIVKMNANRLPDLIKKSMTLPEKEMALFGLGTGQLTGKITRGFSRLFTVDTERECQCEAAAFFVAYSLGLPCFAFRPNALEGAILMYDSKNKYDVTKTKCGWDAGILDPLLSDAGLLKMLMWLMAPVALESSLHPQLIVSDPREARGLIKRINEKAFDLKMENELGKILQLDNQETEDMLKWAYIETDLLLRKNKSLVAALTEKLIGGASTVGDCVAVLEGWQTV